MPLTTAILDGGSFVPSPGVWQCGGHFSSSQMGAAAPDVVPIEARGGVNTLQCPGQPPSPKCQVPRLRSLASQHLEN